MAFWERHKKTQEDQDEEAEENRNAVQEGVDANQARRRMAKQAQEVVTQAEILRIQALKLKEMVDSANT